MRGDGLYRVGRTWYMTYETPDGKRHRVTTGKRDYQEAKAVRASTVGAVVDGRPVVAASRVTFAYGADLIRADYQAKGWRSRGTLNTSLKRLGEYFAARRPLASIGWSDALQYRLWRQGQGFATATINKHLAALKHLLRLAAKDHKLAAVPAIDIPAPENAREGFFEREDFEGMLEHLLPAYRPVTWFAYHTGWRLHSEVLPLRWTQVELAAGVVRLEAKASKNKRGRTFPFDALPELAALIRTQHAHAHGPYVFHEAGRAIDYHRYLTAWHQACEAAECRDRIPHDLRRTAVRNLVRAGVPEKTAMALTGHKTRAVFDRYDIVDEQDLRDGVAKLAQIEGVPDVG